MRGQLAALAAGILVLALAGFSPIGASAQSPGIDPGRDCQTVRICNFGRGGAFRGCISSYTCRTCRLVPSRCSVGTVSRNCQRMQCGWGA